MKHAAPGKCPVCGHGFKVTELKCDGCGAVLRGDFSPCAFCTLDKEQLAFLTAFLSCRGSLKDMEKALGISYPTIKNRLESLITALGLQEEQDCREILRRVSQGKLSSRQALELMEKGERQNKKG